jgi:hypothetical protein
MRRIMNATIAVLALGVGLATAPALFAQSPQNPANPPMGRGMMGSGQMGDMAGMMKQMRAMMDACNKMMAETNQPAPSPEQPRESPPAQPK